MNLPSTGRQNRQMYVCVIMLVQTNLKLLLHNTLKYMTYYIINKVLHHIIYKLYNNGIK